MVLFINQTGTLGIIFNYATTNITGSPFLTLLFLTLIIMAFFMAFRLPVEASSLFILPMLLVYMSFFSEFIAVGGVFLIYIALILAKNFFIK